MTSETAILSALEAGNDTVHSIMQATGLSQTTVRVTLAFLIEDGSVVRRKARRDKVRGYPGQTFVLAT